MKKVIFIFLLLTVLSIFSYSIVLAAGDEDKKEPAISSATVSLTNPLGTGAGNTSIPVLLGKIISSVLGVVGSLALVMFIYGGITWMLSAGNQEQVTKGKNILIWATVGIVIIFTAYALVKFVIGTVAGGV